jgi:ankyrin repeat protein
MPKTTPSPKSPARAISAAEANGTARAIAEAVRAKAPEVADMILKSRFGQALQSEDLVEAVEACVEAHSPFLKPLLESRAAQWSAALSDSCALRKAIETRRPKTLNLLLEHGAPPNSPRSHGETLLAWAISVGASQEIISSLLSAGADPMLSASGHLAGKPLFAAASNGRPEIVRTLIAAGATIPPSQCGDYLTQASRHDDNESLSLLASIATSIDAPCSANGNTALYNFASSGYPKAFKILLAAGADWTIESADGHNALGEALACQVPDAVIAILETGAKPGKVHVDGEDRSVLQWAKKMQLETLEGWIRAHRQRDELEKASKPKPTAEPKKKTSRL